MKINRILFEGETPVVEIENEEVGADNGQPLDDVSSAPDSSMDAPPPLDDGGGGAGGDGDSSVAPDSSFPDGSELDDASELAEGDEDIEVVSTPDERLLLTTPLDTYTVTEGLLLISVILLALCGIITVFKGR